MIPASIPTPSHTTEGKIPPRLSHIECARCTQPFAPSDENRGYATGCASSQARGLLQGHYGSVRHDGQRYTITRSADIPHGVLCDGCIDVLVISQALIPIIDAPAPDPFSSCSLEELESLLDAIDQSYNAL